MGVATGCGSKEVYTFPHTTYSYSSVSVIFYAASLLFVHFFNVFRIITPNHDFLLRVVCKLRYFSDIIHSFDWKSAIEHDGGV